MLDAQLGELRDDDAPPVTSGPVHRQRLPVRVGRVCGQHIDQVGDSLGDHAQADAALPQGSVAFQHHVPPGLNHLAPLGSWQPAPRGLCCLHADHGR